MKVIIAGSRDLHGVLLVEDTVGESGFKITEIVFGTAVGIDRDGEYWAQVNNVPIKKMPAQWSNINVEGAVVKENKYGRKYNVLAGIKRNIDMAEYADALIAIWNGKSRGTKHMIDIAKEKGLMVFVKEIS